MRQVFSSARLENVESVATFLNDAGIATRITNGRSYKKAIRGDFSYRDDARQFPAVWIVYSQDQPRAREMLRGAGLMDSTRNAPDSDLAMSFRGTNPDPRDRLDDADGARRRRAFRIKLGLLFVIGATVMLALLTRPSSTPTAVTATADTGARATSNGALAGMANLPMPGTANVPTSLSLAVLSSEIPTDAGAVACLAVDGRDAPSALIASLPTTAATLLPASQCPARAPNPKSLPLVLAIGNYQAGASGAGTVAFQRRRLGGLVITQNFSVRPDGDQWRVIQLLDTSKP